LKKNVALNETEKASVTLLTRRIRITSTVSKEEELSWLKL
jgi:hypothetical protein